MLARVMATDLSDARARPACSRESSALKRAEGACAATFKAENVRQRRCMSITLQVMGAVVLLSIVGSRLV
jgi:hypothetical protein